MFFFFLGDSFLNDLTCSYLLESSLILYVFPLLTIDLPLSDFLEGVDLSFLLNLHPNFKCPLLYHSNDI